MIKKEEVYKIGRIGKTHGVKGEVTFNFDDDVFDRVDAEYLAFWYLSSWKNTVSALTVPPW